MEYYIGQVIFCKTVLTGFGEETGFMARIPDAVIARLKAEVSLERLAEARGVVLKRHGADRIGLCPFHDDHEPSLVVSPAKNLWHCLGACQRGGSVIDWVMTAEGVSFRHAVALLQSDHLPLAAGEDRRPAKHTTVPKLTPLPAKSDGQALLAQVIDYYHATLMQSPEARDYLARRGLDNPALIAHFKLGFANRTLGYRLPAKTRKAGAAIRGQLQHLGILRTSGHEHFNGSIVIPIVNSQGSVLNVYGRKVTRNLRKGTCDHLYLPGPHRGVFNEGALAGTEEVILCESLIDALTFWSAGYRHVTASYGVSGFTDAHLTAFKHHGIGRVLIAYDRDEAGNAAATTLAERLSAEGLDCYRVLFPKGMDANEYALKLTPAQKSLGLVLRKAAWLGKGRAPALTTAVVGDDGHRVTEPSNGGVAEPCAPETAAQTPPALPSLAAADATAPVPASPLPPAPVADIDAEVSEREVAMALGDRRYRIRGLGKTPGGAQLRVNVLVRRGEAFHVDTLDLYAAKSRAAYSTQAAAELGVAEDVIKHDLGKVLLKLEALQDAAVRTALAPARAHRPLTDAERDDALVLLRSPDLIARIAADIAHCGLVGESTNTLVGYLACVSRKLEAPLAIIIQSTSAAGKSALMDTVLAMMPEEARVHYSAMTGQSLFYMGETDLQHKILAIAEEAGVAEATYALKLLQSEGELTIASTGKDPTTGKLVTQEYRVEGPVMLFLTTTAIDLDEELRNRCLVLSVNETHAQTRAIQERQRFEETLEGLLAAQSRDTIVRRHRNAQRLLQPLKVVNPYAHHLTFLSDKTRTRRDHKKYLTLIRTVALLHQYQRPVKTVTRAGNTVEYIEVTLDDIAIANRLVHEVLGRTLDELPPQTRRLLALIDAMVTARAEALAMRRADYRFSRRDVREHTGWGNTQLKIHLHRLEELEYLLVHRGDRGRRFVYELLYDGDGAHNAPFLMGLIDVDVLKRAYDAKQSGGNTARSGSGRPTVGGMSGPGRDRKNAISAAEPMACDDSTPTAPENAYPGTRVGTPSYADPASMAKG
jgi:DNA primase catalytic core